MAKIIITLLAVMAAVALLCHSCNMPTADFTDIYAQIVGTFTNTFDKIQGIMRGIYDWFASVFG